MSVYRVSTRTGHFTVGTTTRELDIKRNGMTYQVSVVAAVHSTGKRCLMHSYWKGEWHPKHRIFGDIGDCFLVMDLTGNVIGQSPYCDQAFSQAEAKL